MQPSAHQLQDTRCASRSRQYRSVARPQNCLVHRWAALKLEEVRQRRIQCRGRADAWVARLSVVDGSPGGGP
jgi:hypothetical protein